jgi:D-3-phosphoglycerate dehydrogenase
MRRLRGKIAGLIGLGHTGRAMVPRLRALGMDVWAHTRSGNDYNTGCRMAGLDELLEHADFISLHCPLTDESRGLLGAGEFSRMKSIAVLVNTSRGALIDRAALAAALETDQLGGAGLDVFDPEPPDLSEPLYRHERVIVTPHAAFLSEESLLELRRRTAEQIAAVLVGDEPEHVVNPQIWNDRRQPT